MRRLLVTILAAAVVASASAPASAATVLAGYKMDQASSGTTPTTLTDSGPATTVNPTITYGGTAAWTSITGGKGLTFTANSCAVSGSLSGTKIADGTTGLGGATQMTIEIVADTTSAANFGELAGIAATSFDEVGAMFVGGASGQVCFEAPMNSPVCYDATPGLHVFTGVFDSPNATSTSRNLVYVDGALATVDGSPTAAVYPTLNAALDAGATNWANNRLNIGCFVSTAAGQGFVGPIYAVYIYARQALSSTVIAAHATALLAAGGNDLDPNAGGGGPTYNALFFSDSEETPSLCVVAGRRWVPVDLDTERVWTPGDAGPAWWPGVTVSEEMLGCSL